MTVKTDCDLLVIGGGITGAGIALEAARRGLSVMLVEVRDFAWGTSSRSSKLVHGGLRYLKEGKPGLTRESVHERALLMRDMSGLVEPQPFLMGHYAGRSPGRWLLGAGLALYDAFAGVRTRSYHAADPAAWLAPHVGKTGLRGATTYLDAKTDDARLVLRVLQEARGLGARLLNYTAVTGLLREAGQVVGAALQGADGAQSSVRAAAVVSATGAWADALRGSLGAPPKLRPLRGSHLLFPLWRLPLAQAIAFMHPRDGRPVFAYPWEGVALVGTTDKDHREDLVQEPGITRAEADYLFEALAWQFPALALADADVLSAYAGVRPVVASGHTDPSRETRDHLLLDEAGLLTVTGGKLTTFRAIARDVLVHLAPRLPAAAHDGRPVFAAHPVSPALAALPAPLRERLVARYGCAAVELVAAAQPGELDAIGGTASVWAELRHAARREQVRHLDDLLLRRTRLGLLLRDGAAAILPRLRTIVAQELGWNDARWAQELTRYRDLIAHCYALPATARSAS
ncbi:glycerol-3-phosphate dehydrogenase/oxidase [Niveibacterium sp.]|uniref:glycerol-3-phosphate dehydrogenase/oxidase n=1 Tax=Niveibacterium sp. TaxID=2017444 RepID=UPI0035AE4908